MGLRFRVLRLWCRVYREVRIIHVHLRVLVLETIITNPKALRTHILRLLGPKTILYEAFGLF